MQIDTERLRLREFTFEDAPVVLELLNDPLWIRFIGDRKVRTVEDACGYITKLRKSYAENGFGLYLVERKADGQPLGMCGLVKRDTLPAPDIGFAFLERHRGAGYAFEAAQATMDYAREALRLDRILAIATHDNDRSSKLLEKLGFSRQQDGDWETDPNDPVVVWAL